LAKLRYLSAVAGGLIVASCGELTPEEQAHSDATIACFERAVSLFPILSEMPESNEQEKESSDFQVDPNGGFVLLWEAKGKKRPLTDRLECRGNLTAQTLEYLELNGVTKRPQPFEIWKY